MINANRHKVLESPHPSPLSASRGYFGSKPYSRINAWLASKGLPEIDWKLPATVDRVDIPVHTDFVAEEVEVDNNTTAEKAAPAAAAGGTGQAGDGGQAKPAVDLALGVGFAAAGGV